MLSNREIMETIHMISDENLDIRTITMGISLLDCCKDTMAQMQQKIYDKITKKAEYLVETGEKIEREYGIPIINKRIAVTPISLLAGSAGGSRYACRSNGPGGKADWCKFYWWIFCVGA